MRVDVCVYIYIYICSVPGLRLLWADGSAGDQSRLEKPAGPTWNFKRRPPSALGMLQYTITTVLY